MLYGMFQPIVLNPGIHIPVRIFIFSCIFLILPILIISLSVSMVSAVRASTHSKLAIFAWIPVFNILFMSKLFHWRRFLTYLIVILSLVGIVLIVVPFKPLEEFKHVITLSLVVLWMLLSALILSLLEGEPVKLHWVYALIPTFLIGSIIIVATFYIEDLQDVTVANPGQVILVFLIIMVIMSLLARHLFARYSWFSALLSTLGVVVVLALPYYTGLSIFIGAWIILPFYIIRSIIKKNLRSTLKISIAVFFLCVLSYPVILLYSVAENYSPPWENHAKLTLRSLGSSQLAFADAYDGNYGTWEELQQKEFIQKGYTRTNIIDNYSLVAFDRAKMVKDKEGKVLVPSSFTMIALPRSQKNKLRTFALGDDQTPRVWVGDASSFDPLNARLHDFELWEPLR
jgi:hypothetical protein